MQIGTGTDFIDESITKLNPLFYSLRSRGISMKHTSNPCIYKKTFY